VTDGVYEFLGMSYTASPVGALRWMPPQPLKHWRQSSLLQLDFGSIDMDTPLKFIKTDGIRSVLERFTKADFDRV
jgi:carboxylesterase type B